ncbi:MAG: hypothetical protein MZW92_30545 [Comamonadaceae bacterium]|nr:hypothetical protein [Comamonadaceae bacterium]
MSPAHEAGLRDEAVAAVQAARRAGHEPRQHRQPERALRTTAMLITPTGMGADDLQPHGPGPRFGCATGAPNGGLAAVVGVALPPGAIYARAARPARRRAHATRRTPPRWPAWPARHAGRSTTWSRWPAATRCRCVPYFTFGTEALSAGGRRGDGRPQRLPAGAPRPRGRRRDAGARR